MARYAKIVAPASPAENALVQADREYVRRGGLRAFTEIAWAHTSFPDKEYKPNWHIEAMCDHYEAQTRGQIRDLVVNIPPAAGKSSITCVMWPVWEWTQNPSQSWLFASYDAGLTRRDAKYARELILSRWFQLRWPGCAIRDPSSVGDTLYYTTAGGFRFGVSVAGKSTGHHAERIVVDDPVKVKGLSPTVLKAAEQWWSQALSTRGNLATRTRTIIMQRVHTRDLSGIALERGFVHLKIPMEYKSEKAVSTPLYHDPRTEEGELLWPSRTPAEAVAQLRADLGPMAAAAQLDQDPRPEGGAVFSREHFRSVTPMGLPARWDLLVQSWDCTFKDSDGTDFVVGQVWGSYKGQFYLLDEVRERMGVPGTIAAIQAWRAKYPRSTGILIEDKANGPAVEQVLRGKVPGIVMLNPEGGKMARANAVQPLFEAGNVFHLCPTLDAFGEPVVPRWVAEHREELVDFPKGDHDDRVDACSQALIYLHGKSKSLASAMAGINPKGMFG